MYSKPPPSVARHRNLKLLNDGCGEFEEDRIIGGNKTGLLEFPWMALISTDEGVKIVIAVTDYKFKN